MGDYRGSERRQHAFGCGIPAYVAGFYYLDGGQIGTNRKLGTQKFQMLQSLCPCITSAPPWPRSSVGCVR